MPSTGRFSPAQIERVDAAVTRLEALDQQARRIDAERLDALAEALDAAWGFGAAGTAWGDRELAYRSLRLEIATALQQSEHVAERLLNLAVSARDNYPETLVRLRAGQLTLDHVRVVAEAGTVLMTGQTEADTARRAAYERDVLPFATEETPNRLRPIAQRLAAEHAAATARERHAEAVRGRRVRVVDLDEGMAQLIAQLPAEEAYAIRDRVTRIARETLEAEAHGVAQGDAAAGAAAPRRSRDEVRADVLRDLLLTGVVPDALVPGTEIQAHVQVVVPASAVGLSPARGADAPEIAELIGYGPVSADAATGIAAQAEAWEQVSVDESGTVLAVDRYRPTPRMRRLLRARDIHCRAPGCRAPARLCDIDHTVDAAVGGETSTANLAHLCRGHHTVKHHTDWSVRQDGGGVLTWTSPSGREHRERPPSRVRFRGAVDPPAHS